MAIKSRGVRAALVLLSLVLMLGAASVGLYLAGVFPAYNELVRQMLWPQVAREERLMEERQEELLRQQTSIQGLFPHLLAIQGAPGGGGAEPGFLMGQAPQPAPPYSCPDDYTLQLLSFQGDSAAGGETSPPVQAQAEPVWTYTGAYPVLTPPGVFSDAVVFMDAQPALVCLDKSTGTPLMRVPCQVYPGTEGFSHLQSYYFKGRAGGWYEVRFEDGLTPPESLSVAQGVTEAPGLEEAFYERLLPERSAMDFINAKMNGLLSVSPAISVPGGVLYAVESGPLAFGRETVSPAFVFSPREQGTYTLGLCDQEGGWIRDNGFVVLYTMAGEALAISLDYVADRPQITTHLSDQELYVVCAGFFPGSLVLDAGATQDFRDNPPAESPMDGMFSAAGEDAAGQETPSEAAADSTAAEVVVLEAPGDSPAVRRAWFQVRRAP